MSQYLAGIGNNQAGRDLIFHKKPEFDSANPNIIKCPQCWLSTGRYSNNCPHCGFDVDGHFIALARRARKDKMVRWGNIAGALGFAIPILWNAVGFEFTGYISGIFIATLGFAMLCFNTAESLK